MSYNPTSKRHRASGHLLHHGHGGGSGDCTCRTGNGPPRPGRVGPAGSVGGSTTGSGGSGGRPTPGSARRVSVCAGCRDEIHDQYVLRVAPDLEWHVDCLRCTDCRQPLDETCTCFVRDDRPYCKRDYVRLFGARCNQCGAPFCENDLVMRARHRIYHTECFRCVVCCRQLVPGDEFCLRGDDGLFCKADYDAVVDCQVPVDTTPATTACSELSNFMYENDSNEMKLNNNNNNNDIKVNDNIACSTRNPSDTAMSGGLPTGTTAGGQSSRSGGSRSHKSDQKTTRVRTVLNEKQLHTLRTCYGANPRPDALMKEQLVEMTGLSPRVIRVWFQNKRCKDKKRSILMKQMQQQQQEKGEMCSIDEMWLCQKGVPMVATSPVRHEPPSSLQLAPIEVHQCQAPPWKALSDFALQSELDQPPFQQLVSSFGESSGDDDDDTVVCLDEPAGRSHHLRQSAASSSASLQYCLAAQRHHQPQASQIVGAVPSYGLTAADASC